MSISQTISHELNHTVEQHATTLSKLERLTFLAIALLMVADVWTTVSALGHPFLFEENAMAEWFISTFGATVGLSIKSVVMLAGIHALRMRLPRWSRPGFLAGAAAPHLIAVATNVQLLVKYGII